jgi:hypothetical protein
MRDNAQQIPPNDCGEDIVHPVLARETPGSFCITGVLPPGRSSAARRHPFVLGPVDRNLKIIGARSIGRQARLATGEIP